MVSVLIADKNIQYVVGKGSSGDSATIYACGEKQIEDEVVRRGVILDSEKLIKYLEELKPEFRKGSKKVNLLLPTGTMVSKILNIPVMPENKIRRVIKEELREFVNENEDIIYDYSVFEKSSEQTKGTRILAVAIQRKVIDSYSEVFNKAGMALESVDIALSSQIKMIQKMQMLSNKTFILGALLGNNLSLALYSAGRLEYYNRYVINNRDGLGFISEVSRILSTVIQFAKSENFNAIEKIFFSGMTETERGLCSNISNTVDINVAILPESSYIKKTKCKDYTLSEYLLTTGNLYRR